MNTPAPQGDTSSPNALVISLLTLGALVAFAANSIMSRLAIGDGAIDAYSFTAVRLASGAVVLFLLNLTRGRGQGRKGGGWWGTLFLILYALPFSLAYVRLDTGTGALLLFGAVQLTMIAYGLRSGDRPRPFEWIGLAGAATGVAYLVSPGVTAPDPVGAGFMITAGIGWGGYSIIGRSAGDARSVTEGNFKRAALLVVPLTALAWNWLDVSPRGVMLAAASGAIASGLGYTLWYAALRYLPLARAALVQLSVPVIAGGGGVVFVGESITLRLALASSIILGSIAIGILGRRERSSSPRH